MPVKIVGYYAHMYNFWRYKLKNLIETPRHFIDESFAAREIMDSCIL